MDMVVYIPGHPVTDQRQFMEKQMPKTESNPIALGAPAADFLLPDADGRLHSLKDSKHNPALLVAFLSNRCPFVRRSERWSGVFDQFAASLSSGMGFMSGCGFQVLVGSIIGFSGRQQPLR